MARTMEEKLNKGREFRALTLEVKEEGEKPDTCIVEGYATTFNDPYLLYEDEDVKYVEQVAPDAFDGCDMSDVIMQYDHQGHVYARIKNNTLSLKIDDHGMKVTADLSKTADGRKLYEEIKGGYTDKMSFSFTVADDECLISSEDNKQVFTRTIKRFKKLYDVSAVSLPANDGTEISARAYLDKEIAKRQMDESAKEAEEKAKAEEELKAKQKENEERARMVTLLSFNF